MPQAQPSQHLSLQDSQMMQRQMLKQFQELQRQQNYLNQQPGNFMPANANFMPHGSSAAVQGFPNGNYQQPQMQGLFLSPSPEQLSESRSMTPVGRSPNTYNQYPHLQGLSSDSAITNTSNYQREKPMQQSLYGRPVFGNQMISTDLHSYTDGAFQSKQFQSGKNLFGQGNNEGFQQLNTSAEEFNSRREQTSSYEQFQGNTTKMDLSQGSTTLDPLEQKILFNMDGNSWSSFGSNTENYTNTFECSDYLSSFPSIQSGSMSALMQSAVAESSSDNGVVQEEWSGLGFPKTELPKDNQPSMNVDVGNQRNEWVDNNVPLSLNGKSQAPFGGTNMNSGFSEFQFPNKHREGTRSDSSHESVQQSPRVGAKWSDGNSGQGPSVGGSQVNHATQPPNGNAFPFQGFQFSGSNIDQRSIFDKQHDQTNTQPSFGSSMQGNQNVASAVGQVHMRNQEQQYPSATAIEAQSPHTYHNVANKLPPFDLFIPRGTSQPSSSLELVGQQFPILESVPVESSRKAPNQWPNASAQARPSVTGPGEFQPFSSDSLNTNLQVPTRGTQDRHGQQNSVGNSSHEAGAGLTNPQVALDVKEYHDKVTAHHRDFPGGIGQTTTQTGLYNGLEAVAKDLQEEAGIGSSPLIGHPQQMNLVGAHGDKQVSSVSARDLEAFGRSLKPSNFHHNYPNSSDIPGSSSDSGTPQLVNPYAFGDANMQPTRPSSVPVASWFRQYGHLRNGQSLIQPSPLGKHAENLETDTSMVPSNLIRNSQEAVELSPPSTLLPDSGGADNSTAGLRKRKMETSNLLPWHLEVIESSKRPRNISVAEIEWAKDVNRRVEKVDYEVKMTADVHPLLRAKKRLVLSRQLMQLVFMPAPAAFLRAKADSSYDAMAYFSAKLALADACNLKSSSINGTALLSSSDDVTTKEPETNEKTSESRWSSVEQNLTSRARKLETDFERLDKSASFVDVIVDFKELEKFSIINRFARYHVRGPPRAAETSSSSDPTPNSLRPAPQRYVMAHRARALPEQAQCLSL